MDHIQTVKEIGPELFGSNPVEHPVSGSRDDARVARLVGPRVGPLEGAPFEYEQQLGLLLQAQIGNFFDQHRAGVDSVHERRVM